MHSLTYTPPADDSIPPIGLNLGMYDNLSRTHPFSAEQGQEAVHGRETEAFQFRSILQNFEWRSTHHCLVIVPCTSCSNVVINRFMYIYTWPLHCLYTRSSELWVINNKCEVSKDIVRLERVHKCRDVGDMREME